MKIATMLTDILHSAGQRPVTQRYPMERNAPPERLRGRLTWSPAACTGCALCTKDCPTGALLLITLDKKAKQFVMSYSVDRCIFCGQCVESCRFDCLTLSKDAWELAALIADDFTTYLGETSNVDKVLVGNASSGAGTIPNKP